ncbi:MAG: alpha-L-fucosidase, partial [Candidatus Symbiothrix sp.]|nr:alpha-L-fucosidase [Candidatus Symbiothrix sp.]
IDWNHPGYRAAVAKTDEEKARYETFKTFTRNQLIELLTNYPPIKGLWFDGSWDEAWTKEAAWVDTLGEELRAMHPGLVIGSRFRADEYGSRHIDSNGDLIDDYDQRFERNLPADLNETKGNDWECVMTIPENQWGYHHDWSLSYVKTPYELIEMMVKTNSLDGNFVLNFGPDGKGNIRPEETAVAEEIGEWMAINSEAVYGVHHSLLEKQDWGYSTQKGDTIYLTVFNKPVNNLLRVKIPKSKNKDMLYVIGKAEFLQTQEVAKIKGEGKTGSYYRDKFGSSYYDIILPANIGQHPQPFVIAIELKEINKNEQNSYQEAII